MKITVVINTNNEEKNIEECIKSAKKLTQDILIVDMESTDKTLIIAKNLNIKTLTFPFQKYVEPAREFAIKNAAGDWVFILDADERLSDELAKEIKNKVKESDSFGYFKIPRKNIFGKIKWLRHGGWWPDYQIRLINKKYFVAWPKQIHSTPEIKGKFDILKNPIEHFFHTSLEEMVKKTTIFEDIESNLLYKAKKKSDTKIFFRKFIAELYRRLLKRLGFLDGTFGIIESVYQAFSKTITYLFLYEKSKQKN